MKKSNLFLSCMWTGIGKPTVQEYNFATKRIIILATMVMLGLPISIQAEIYKGKCGPSAKWELNTETGVLHISGTGKITRLYSPYSEASKVTSIIIDKNITSIDTYSLNDFSKLKSIHIPSTVKSISSGAFNDNNENIVDVYVTDLEDWNNIKRETHYGFRFPKYNLFLNNSKVTNTRRLGSKVKKITDCAFYNCVSLTAIHIPEQVEQIGRNAFDGCDNVTSIIWGGN